MSLYKINTDLYYTEDGDFWLDEDQEDLEDTKNYQLRGFIQDINTVMSSTPGDWRNNPVGVALTDFMGKPNTRVNGERIRSRVYSALIREGLVSPSDLTVQVFPIGLHTLALVLQISQPGISTKTLLTYTYSFKDNKMIPRNL